MKGKRAIELGSGMGLGGLALALLGCQTVLTDTKEVLSLLQRNYENNLAPAALRGQDFHQTVGDVTVQELDWTQTEQYTTVQPPFDFVLAADCVYHEDITLHFLLTVVAMTHIKSTVVVVNELRSEAVHNRFMSLFEQYFTIKRTPRSKMDSVHQHSAIDILILKRRKEHASTTWQDVKESHMGSPTLQQT